MEKTEIAGGRFRNDLLMRYFGIALILGMLARQLPLSQALIDALSNPVTTDSNGNEPRLSK